MRWPVLPERVHADHDRWCHALPEAWAIKCWENYGPGGGDPADPCGTGEGTVDETLTLPGGMEVPVTVVSIPKQLWTDPPVVDWINDRNDNALFELGQHGTYHTNNIPMSDWAALPDRNFYSCEPCGLTLAENFELMKMATIRCSATTTTGGPQTREPQAVRRRSTGQPRRILCSVTRRRSIRPNHWREAIAAWASGAFSASTSRKSESIARSYAGRIHHEEFDQFGMFHASADLELEPPDTTGDTYDPDAYEAYLQSRPTTAA